MRLFSMLAALATAVAGAPAAAASFGCPQTIDAAAGAVSSTHAFRYVSFFDGPPEEMVELAPEDFSRAGKLSLRWRFDANRDRPIVMICRYHGAEATARFEAPATIRLCRLRGKISPAGEIVGSPRLACR
jgi:hypothetical protein